MPLIGVVDPSYVVTKNDDYTYRPTWYTIDEVLQHSAEANPKWSPYTYELLMGFLAEYQERDYISTTMVSGGCPRGAVLERKEDHIATIDSFYPAFMGTMIHAILEKYARPNSMAEYRFHAEVDGVPFSCSPDLITPEGRMWDYKRTENLPAYGDMWDSHSRQLQFNRFVVNNATRVTRNGEEVTEFPFDYRTMKFTELSIVYLGPKKPKIITDEIRIPYRRKDGEWAQNKRRIPRILEDEQILGTKEEGTKFDRVDYSLRKRVHAMQTALDSYPKWPSGLENYWIGPAGWECPGPPHCYFPNCLAKRYPNGLMWER